MLPRRSLPRFSLVMIAGLALVGCAGEEAEEQTFDRPAEETPAPPQSDKSSPPGPDPCGDIQHVGPGGVVVSVPILCQPDKPTVPGPDDLHRDLEEELSAPLYHDV